MPHCPQHNYRPCLITPWMSSIHHIKVGVWLVNPSDALLISWAYVNVWPLQGTCRVMSGLLWRCSGRRRSVSTGMSTAGELVDGMVYCRQWRAVQKSILFSDIPDIPSHVTLYEFIIAIWLMVSAQSGYDVIFQSPMQTVSYDSTSMICQKLPTAFARGKWCKNLEDGIGNRWEPNRHSDPLSFSCINVAIFFPILNRTFPHTQIPSRRQIGDKQKHSSIILNIAGWEKRTENVGKKFWKANAPLAPFAFQKFFPKFSTRFFHPAIFNIWSSWYFVSACPLFFFGWVSRYWGEQRAIEYRGKYCNVDAPERKPDQNVGSALICFRSRSQPDMNNGIRQAVIHTNS